MAGVIKAGQLDARREREQSESVFTLDDLRKHGDNLLTEVRAQAADLLRQARNEADAIRQQAAIDGQADALQAATEKVRAELSSQAATILPAIEQMLEELRLAKEQWASRWNRAVLELSAAIASKVVRRELTQQPEISQELLREAIELAGGAQHIQLYLHPQDVDSLGPFADQLTSQFETLGDAMIKGDESIEPGFCRIVTEYGEIDQTLATQLARIVDELQ